MKFSDIKECTVCGGNGSWCGFYGEPAFCEVCSKDNTGSCGCAICCSHCQGTGQEPIRIVFYVPDGGLKNRTRFKVPTLGEELTLVCDSCGGTERKCRGDGIICPEQDYVSCRGCPDYYNDLCNACFCAGTPKKTIKITEVEYKQIGSEHGVNVYYEVIP